VKLLGPARLDRAPLPHDEVPKHFGLTQPATLNRRASVRAGSHMDPECITSCSTTSKAQAKEIALATQRARTGSKR
jgi:hypothetical protein